MDASYVHRCASAAPRPARTRARPCVPCGSGTHLDTACQRSYAHACAQSRVGLVASAAVPRPTWRHGSKRPRAIPRQVLEPSRARDGRAGCAVAAVGVGERQGGGSCVSLVSLVDHARVQARVGLPAGRLWALAAGARSHACMTGHATRMPAPSWRALLGTTGCTASLLLTTASSNHITYLPMGYVPCRSAHTSTPTTHPWTSNSRAWHRWSPSLQTT